MITVISYQDLFHLFISCLYSINSWVYFLVIRYTFIKLSFRKTSPPQYLQIFHWGDVTGLDLTKLDLNVTFSERQFTLMDGTALPKVVLQFTQQDCIVLDIALQIEIHRTVLQWAGLSGLDWTGQRCTSLDWIVAVSFHGVGLFQMEIHCNLLACMGLYT